MSNIGEIVEGFFNKTLNLENDLYKNRIEICRCCKLLKLDSVFGEICNNKLYLNPINNEVSSSDKKGYFKGCGCVLSSKCRSPKSKCPANK